MRPYILTTLLICSLAFSACEPEIIKPSPPAGSFVFGGIYNEVATDIIELSDGNFLMLGGMQDLKGGDYDVSMTKLTPDGAELWTKVYREENQEEYGVRILKEDAGYVVLALRESGQYNSTSAVINWYDEDFNKFKTRVLGNPGGGFSRNDSYSDFFKRKDGGYLIPLSSNNGINLARLDADGVTEEPVVIGDGGYYSLSTNVGQKPNGGFVMISGNSDNFNSGIAIYHLDEQGSLISTMEIDVNYSYLELIKEVVVADDGTYYFTFSEYEVNPELVQIDSMGTVLSQTPLGSEGDYNSIFFRPDGSLVLAGGAVPYSYSNYSNTNAYLAVVDSGGTLLSSETWGGDSNEKIRGAHLASNGNLYMVGNTQSYGAGGTDMYLIITQP